MISMEQDTLYYEYQEHFPPPYYYRKEELEIASKVMEILGIDVDGEYDIQFKTTPKSMLDMIVTIVRRVRS